MRIAVLSDVHGHAQAYADALAAARGHGFDELLILGDLLTYGVDPQRVMDLTADAVARDGAHVILGNHDQIYFDLDAGGSAYAEALPEWIRESVDWTRDRLGTGWGQAPFDWRTHWTSGDLYAAHANPYAYGDWTYLSTEASMRAAAEALSAAGLRHGVFGHTHRFRIFDDPETGGKIVTVGSLGQPRDVQDPRSQWAVLELSEHALTVEAKRLDVDWESHKQSIRSTTLSEFTKVKLCGFFSA